MELNIVEVATVLGVLAAVATAYATLRKLPKEEGSLVLTQTQGAATVLNDLVSTLYKELERRDQEIKRLQAKVDEYESTRNDRVTREASAGKRQYDIDTRDSGG